MAYAQNFDRKLWEELQKRVPQYTWKLAWSADERSIVDVAGLVGGIPRVLIEVELKKDNPVENVVKVWSWSTQNRPRKHRTVFIQAFSALYGPGGPKRKQYERAAFVGHKMARDPSVYVKYLSMCIFGTTRGSQQREPFQPRMRPGWVTKSGGTSMHRAARNLAADIAISLSENPGVTARDV